MFQENKARQILKKPQHVVWKTEPSDFEWHHRNHHNEVWSQCLPGFLVRFEPGTFQFVHNAFTRSLSPNFSMLLRVTKILATWTNKPVQSQQYKH